jgi:hypothetical protein
MSKLVRTLMLGAMLAAMNLAAVTAVAQERTATGHAAELFRVGERASQERTATGHAAELFRAGERASTTHRDDVGTTPAEATRPARPAGPLGRPGLLVTLGVLAAALAAVTAARATRRVRARQAV